MKQEAIYGASLLAVREARQAHAIIEKRLDTVLLFFIPGFKAPAAAATQLRLEVLTAIAKFMKKSVQPDRLELAHVPAFLDAAVAAAYTGGIAGMLEHLERDLVKLSAGTTTETVPS